MSETSEKLPPEHFVGIAASELPAGSYSHEELEALSHKALAAKGASEAGRAAIVAEGITSARHAVEPDKAEAEAAKAAVAEVEKAKPSDTVPLKKGATL